MEGWIKLHRKIQDNWLWQEKRKFSKFEAWVSLLLKANHKENKILVGNEIITIQAGSFMASEVNLSKEWAWSRNTVRKFLLLLKKEKMLTQTCTTKYTIISIENWALYQFNEQQVEQQIEQQIEQQVNIKLNTNKNVKNDKNVKNGRNNISASEETSSADTAKANSKHKYGEYGNVLLKDEELQKLKEEYENWEELIKYLDEYIEMKGYKAKSHYLCIKKWVVDAVKKQNLKINKSGTKEEKPDGADIWLKKMKEKEKQNNAI